MGHCADLNKDYGSLSMHNNSADLNNTKTVFGEKKVDQLFWSCRRYYNLRSGVTAFKMLFMAGSFGRLVTNKERRKTRTPDCPWRLL
jgi:hypothetical protein